MNQPELNLPDPDPREIRFPALKATQPIGDLYVAVISAKDLGLISNFDVRRVLQEERDVERFALAKTRSPQRTCHNVAVALDADPDSPFHRRIKRLGVATPGRVGETITQATFVLSLLPYISTDPKLDRDKLLRGETLERADNATSQKLIFRNMFIDSRDLEIANILFNYFTAVRDRWRDGWNTRERGLILHRTSAFRALMVVFRSLYLSLGKPGDVVPTEAFSRAFAKVRVESEHFNTENYLPGTSGEVALRNDLLEWLGLQPEAKPDLLGKA